ncbi:MAG: histidinol dehydrogenase [Alicyclobacillus sp.]|nr:histidinol dehydrogenase [Alicyclobacillus sp.]
MAEYLLRRVEASAFEWNRSTHVDPAAESRVREIVADVREGGDSALRRWTATLDTEQAAAADWDIRVPEAELQRAWEGLGAELRAAITDAADRIRTFHAQQLPKDLSWVDADGATLGLTWRPLGRVGVYAPGGRAAYPSTVLMNVIPAQVAGVTDIVLASPPQPDTGWPHPLVLAAAHAVGVRDVVRVGGAQAVAAFAYGTESVRRVDKLAGPGNLYVALAKRAVMGDVGIDSIAGPSEVFIVADETADPAYIAADLLAQAEHDPEAGAVCVLTDASLADAVEAALRQQVTVLPRRTIAEQALARWGALVTAASRDEVIAVVNRSAPEHVELMVAQPEAWLHSITRAGAVFLGPYTPEPVGDYFAGPNHVLPTHGTARFASGLGVLDFLRRMTYVSYPKQTLARHARRIQTLAEAEGLSGHARSVAIRLQTAQEGDGR